MQKKGDMVKPPFSNSVKTNVERTFLRLADRHFPRGHKLNKPQLATRVVYKTSVSTDSEPCKLYIGMAGGTFKERYNNYNKSFRHVKYEKETELSKYVCLV